MALKWTKEQSHIYQMLTSGSTKKEVMDTGYKRKLVEKVIKAIDVGDTTEAPEAPPGAPSSAKHGEPLFEATTRTVKEELPPIILIRWDSVRSFFGWNKKAYPLSNFLDEGTNVLTQMVGAVPPGFIRVEDKDEIPEPTPDNVSPEMTAEEAKQIIGEEG